MEYEHLSMKDITSIVRSEGSSDTAPQCDKRRERVTHKRNRATQYFSGCPRDLREGSQFSWDWRDVRKSFYPRVSWSMFACLPGRPCHHAYVRSSFAHCVQGNSQQAIPPFRSSRDMSFPHQCTRERFIQDSRGVREWKRLTMLQKNGNLNRVVKCSSIRSRCLKISWFPAHRVLW